MSLNRATKMKVLMIRVYCISSVLNIFYIYIYIVVQVRSMRLPIDEYIPQRRTHILNIDTAVSILVSLLKTGDIRTAILSK